MRAAAEDCIGIVSASLPTMRPIYSLMVHGHACSSQEGYCSRCEHFRTSGRHSIPQIDTKWPGSTPSSVDEWTSNARTSASDIESANRSDLAVGMALHAKDPAPALESVVIFGIAIKSF